MTKVKLMNMCMVYNSIENKVVVLDKVNVKEWQGITFPGGHVENGEGIISSTIREIKEETGLIIKNLKHCGLINWYNTKTHERWFIFLYKTENYSGKLIDETHEGKVFWIDIDDLHTIKLASDMKEYLKLFLDENINEAYAEWNDKEMTSFEFY